MKKYTLIIMALFGAFHLVQAQQQDKYLWLEEVDDEKALEYVEEQNEATFEKLSSQPYYQEILDKNLEILNSNERIAYPTIRGEHVYNYWRDEDNPRGIWRRCALADYLKGSPDWEVMLDIDALSKKDDIKWVYKGVSGLHPSYDRFLVRLSKGGGDAVVVKEFDANKKEFIEDGYFIDEAKGSASFLDANTVIVSSDFGEGTMTTSGYPRQVKLWKRGTPLKDAQLIYEGETSDVGTWGSVFRDGSKSYVWMSRMITFYNSQSWVKVGDEVVKLDLPDDAGIKNLLNDQLIVELKSDLSVDGQAYKSGTLVSFTLAKLLKGEKEIQVVVEPDEFSSISGVSATQNKLLINILTDVTGQLFIYSYKDGKWMSEKVNTPEFGTISIVGTDELSDKYFINFQNFITPSTLYTADASNNTFKAYQSLPDYFDDSKYQVKQHKVKSKDGTMVPYFIVSAKDAKFDGTNPTLINAYGGFQVSRTPFYAATFGVSWLDKGGVFVLANIRGGGEYGPQWHQAGLKEKRQNVFDDLYAVSEDLIAKKVTSPKHLGVMGGSNGGLLVGVALTQRPDLYNAVVCQVPLLDMQRFNKLLAGASWMGEYGNPDVPEEWAYIQKYSPYHNVKKGMDYPEVFFYTSTRDDRVHPGHARKMNAKMNEMGYKTYYYENTEGGHAGSSTNDQRAKSSAMTFSYLLMQLK